MTTIEIGGSWGHVTIDAITGKAIEYDHEGTLPDPDDATEKGYEAIHRFDLAEWRATYPGKEPTAIDILDLGYWWGPDNTYEPPAQDWRDEFGPESGI
jgi:hypothetical protein